NVTSTGRYVPISINLPGARRRARAEMRSTVEGSAQCRSSSTSSNGLSDAIVSNASPISRSMRSRVAPRISRCSVSRCSRFTRAGNCTQPGRCSRSQCLHHGVSPGIGAQPTQRFEHGVIGFFASETFDALTACHTHAAKIYCSPAQKLVGQGCFPNARFTGDKDNLPVILQAPLKAVSQLGQGRIPSNQFPRGQLRCELCFGRRVTDGSNEPVAPSGKCLDEAGILGAIAQRAANAEDVRLEYFRLDERIGP